MMVYVLADGIVCPVNLGLLINYPCITMCRKLRVKVKGGWDGEGMFVVNQTTPTRCDLRQTLKRKLSC